MFLLNHVGFLFGHAGHLKATDSREAITMVSDDQVRDYKIDEHESRLNALEAAVYAKKSEPDALSILTAWRATVERYAMGDYDIGYIAGLEYAINVLAKHN